MPQTYTLPSTTGIRNRTIVITPLAITKYLFLTVLLLLTINLVILFLEAQSLSQAKLIEVFKRYFDFNTEANIPTLFSSFILFTAAGISFFIYKTELMAGNGNILTRPWLLISLVFIFLTFDESFQIHEKFGPFAKALVSSEVLIHVPIKWVIPYMFILFLVAVFLLKFIILLPKKTRNLFFFSGFIFLLGAVILEEVGGYYWILYGKESFYFKSFYVMEELLEMSGVILFIYALLDYAALSHSRILIAIESDLQDHE